MAIRKGLDQGLRISMHMFSSCISLRSGHKEKFILGIFILDYIYIISDLDTNSDKIT